MIRLDQLVTARTILCLFTHLSYVFQLESAKILSPSNTSRNESELYLQRVPIKYLQYFDDVWNLPKRHASKIKARIIKYGDRHTQLKFQGLLYMKITKGLNT